MYAHTVIIGGTGMLFAASVQLAAQSHRFTSAARTHASLARLDVLLPKGCGPHHMLPLDWSEPEAFVAGIPNHIEATEEPDLVVAWVHDEQLGIRVGSVLGRGNVQFFHVIGSAAANPGQIAAHVQAEANLPSNVAYHQVILGAAAQGNHARWLTNAEIASGVLKAVQAQQLRFVVGTLKYA